MREVDFTDATLPEDAIQTREDLEKALVNAKIKRVRVIEVSDTGVALFFVPRRKAERLGNLLENKWPGHLGYKIGTLKWYECLIRRREYVIM